MRASSNGGALLSVYPDSRNSLRLVQPRPMQLQFDFDAAPVGRLLAHDHGRWELDRDRIVPLEPTPSWHRAPAVRLVRLLRELLEHDSVVTDLGFVLARNPHIVRFPFAAVSSRPEPIDGLVVNAPYVAVEVMPSREGRIEFGRRVEQFLAGGTSHVWVVDGLQDIVQVHRCGEPVHSLGRLDTLSVCGEEVALSTVFTPRVRHEAA